MSTSYVRSAQSLVETASPEHIRNMCIIAHVDHGKTTLSDFLLSSNQHVSVRQIEGGQKTGEAVRFLDSRLDEINRQITIKSSCISLTYEGKYLVNLIDSPGHVDFASEVSAAARLTDGAILVVDAVEGVRAQTCSVIRQAWSNRIVPILFINKLDKLSQLVSDPMEAYGRIRSVIENVNLLFHDLLEADKEERELSCIPETELQMYQFDPVRGNVLFGSALHGWTFDLRSWTSKLVAPKLPAGSPEVLPFMFGEWAWGKNKVVAVSAAHPTPLFVKFVLEPLWGLCFAGTASSKLCLLFPVAASIFSAVVAIVPSPIDALSLRSDFLGVASGPLPNPLVFVVKQLPADLRLGCLLGDRVDEVRQLTGFVSLARVFAGSFVLGSNLRSACGEDRVVVKAIHLLMGASLVPVARAVAGSVVALEFETDLAVAGGVTLIPFDHVDPFAPLVSPYESCNAIVQVTTGVRRSADEQKLDLGLALLAKSDPAVVVSRHAQTGERLVGCCGDEHLARCVQDLENLFAKGVDILVSAPIVEIRESIAEAGFVEGVDADQKLPVWLSEYTPKYAARAIGDVGGVAVRCSPIPRDAMAWLESHIKPLVSVFHEHQIPAVWSATCGSVDACTAFVKQVVLADRFGVENVVDVFVKNDAVNILASPEPLAACSLFGFRQVCLAGPLAEEPVRGVLWTVTSYTPAPEHPSLESFALASACRGALLASAVRVAEPILSLELQTEEIRPAQNLLATRRADIFYSDLVEGSYSEYLIKAWIPASEAFKTGDKSKLTFSDELRSATHGKVVWRLAFSHWAVLENSSPLVTNSVAHKLVCGVRKRKGLSVGEKVVADADKQRTLTKMK